MADRAEVLVHGATGFTGKLVCAALARRGVRFAVGGRNADKLAVLSDDVGAAESCVIDLSLPGSLVRAFEGRRLVCACAGPFLEVGEAPLATCARLGVSYVDTTGEQLFVARAVTRYRATAEASGACVVPAMAYEIALADWAAHLAAERLGKPPDSIDIVYATRGAGSATRGTKRSAVMQMSAGDAMQFVDGALREERAATVVRAFRLHGGAELTAVSFPSPEAVVVPSHAQARTVRTFMVVGRRAGTMHALRSVLPLAMRVARPFLVRAIGRAPEGPDDAVRERSTFEVIAEATQGGTRAAVHVLGHDPYGLTAELQAYAASRAVSGELRARGVVAPSVAMPPKDGFAMLADHGVTVHVTPAAA
jgi:short subunit dehydrogenase-like uncharacterized protein